MIKDNHYLKAQPSTAFVYSIIKRGRKCQSIFLNTIWLPTDIDLIENIISFPFYMYATIWLPTDIENIISFSFYMYANALFPLCRVLAIPF